MVERPAAAATDSALRPDDTAPRHVWLVNLFFGPGPAPTGVLLASLGDDLVRRGWRVEVLTGTAEYRADTTAAAAPFGGIVHRFRCAASGAGLRSKFRVWLTFYLKVAWFILWRRLPDIVIVQTTPPFLHTLFALRSVFSWRRPKIILWNQDTYPETLVATGMLRESSFVYRLLQSVARWSANWVTHAVVLDGAMADRLRKQGIKHLTVIPNWDVTPQEDNSAADSSATLPLELQQLVTGYRFRVAYTGNLGRGHDLTPVWDYLRRHPGQSKFCFLFIGEGDRTAELKQLVQHEGWTSIRFWPYLPTEQFTALLRWADFGLVALEPECVGLMSPSKMHAWLGAGKPVIYVGPEGSNVSETLSEFGCGISVNRSAPHSFEHAVIQLSNDTEIEHMRRQCRIAWESRHSPQVGLRAWSRLLLEV